MVPFPSPRLPHASAGDHFSFSGPPAEATWADLPQAGEVVPQTACRFSVQHQLFPAHQQAAFGFELNSSLGLQSAAYSIDFGLTKPSKPQEPIH